MENFKYNKQQDFKVNKFVTAGILAFSALTALMVPATASAGLVTGNAIFTIDNDAVTASIPAPNTNYSFVKHWGASDNAITIDGTGGTSIPTTGTTALSFAVNSNGTDIVYATDRVTRATTMDASDTSVGQIGLSGAMQMSGDTGSLFPKDFYMVKVGSTWNIQAPFTGFGDPTLFTLTNVSESLDVNGELLLSGDLYWATAGLNWTAVTNADGAIKLGTFSLAPVPVPAAVWLFGSGLLGLIATGRKNARIA